MGKEINIPPWVRKLGIIGLLLFFLLTLLKLAIEAIFEQTVQNWWEQTALPAFTSPIEMQFTIYGWHIVAITALLLAAVSGIIYLLRKRCTKRRLNLGILRKPESMGLDEFNPTDVLKARDQAKKGEFSREDLAQLVIQAVNFGVIRPQAAVETLEEFEFGLVSLSDGSYKIIDRRKIYDGTR